MTSRAEILLSKVLTLVIIYFEPAISISYSFACQSEAPVLVSSWRLMDSTKFQSITLIMDTGSVPLSRSLFLEVRTIVTVHLQRSLFVLESVLPRLLIFPPFPDSISNKEGAGPWLQSSQDSLLTVFLEGTFHYKTSEHLCRQFRYTNFLPP
jgi:hypothetical protein